MNLLVSPAWKKYGRSAPVCERCRSWSMKYITGGPSSSYPTMSSPATWSGNSARSLMMFWRATAIEDWFSELLQQTEHKTDECHFEMGENVSSIREPVSDHRHLVCHLGFWWAKNIYFRDKEYTWRRGFANCHDPLGRLQDTTAVTRNRLSYTTNVCVCNPTRTKTGWLLEKKWVFNVQ